MTIGRSGWLLRARANTARNPAGPPGPGLRRSVGIVVVGLLALLAVLALGAVALASYTVLELHRFERAEARRSTRIYAAGQPLAPGISVKAIDLAGTLARLKYRETDGTPEVPGQFRRGPGAWEVYARRLDGDLTGGAAHVRLELRGDRIVRVLRDGSPVDGLRLEPEVLTGDVERPGEEFRPVRLAEVPLVLLHAVLAAEDHRFFEHAGVDLRSLARAAWANLRAGRLAQGGSTITQQLVKNRLVGSRRTLGRKLREAWMAAVVEWRYPKEQILEAYLDAVYLGQHGVHAVRGVGAAARAYFGKEVHQLTLGEAALLAGMIRAPNSYSPALEPRRARSRRDSVLARMRELGIITDAEHEAARRETIRKPPPPAGGRDAPYFVDYVHQEMESWLGDAGDAGRGVRLVTTLDLALQRFAEAAVRRGLERLEAPAAHLRRRPASERLQAALVALDPVTGQILALVGGRDYRLSQFNRVFLARRQPGSAFKPFVFLAALRARPGGPAFTAASMVDDEPIVLEVDGEPWTPRNYEERYQGRVTVRRALEHSLNAATVRMAQEIGLPAVIETARALGISSPLRPVPAMSLGAFEVTPIELARAYLPLAGGGQRPGHPLAVRAAHDGNGEPLELPAGPTRQVISPAEAYLMTSLLQGVVTFGTGAGVRALGVTGPVAGKTGTTNDGRDAWFVGYAPNLLALVWVGFDTGEAHGLSGAQAALPIWADFMRQSLDAYPPPPLSVPPGIVAAAIDAGNGKRATLFCPIVTREVFLEGSEPAPCDEHGPAERLSEWWQRLREWLRR